MAMCEAGDAFDVIVSDIEMPGMSGFEFARAVRANSRWQGTPMVALSSHATPEDFDRGREAGFSDYVAKFDRDTLLQTLGETLSVKGAA
jgi:two-component system chemotaxis sensor kinase CheA